MQIYISFDRPVTAEEKAYGLRIVSRRVMIDLLREEIGPGNALAFDVSDADLATYIGAYNGKTK